jgi:hypothetical protein
MIAIKWPTTKRRTGKDCRIAFIEMKYGYGALIGKAGMIKHLKDMDSLISDQTSFIEMCKVIEKQFNQLDHMGLLKFNKGEKYDQVTINHNVKPEVIVILANHNPRASVLRTILNTPEITEYSRSQNFDLRFFVASFSGYGYIKNVCWTCPPFVENYKMI